MKIKHIGLIVEDESDFGALRVLIERISATKKTQFSKFFAKGCGKLKKELCNRARNLFIKGCDCVIVVCDSDKLDPITLRKELEAVCDLKENLFIFIAVQELEAWFLSDPRAVIKKFGLRLKPNFSGKPEEVDDPKEKLGREVKRCSQSGAIYVNTLHNIRLAELLSLREAKKKCPSFEQFHDFVNSHTYQR